MSKSARFEKPYTMMTLTSVNFTEDGNWSTWGAWADCSKTCDEGGRSRIRTCTNPPPRGGGKYCSGKSSVNEPCSYRPCPRGKMCFMIIRTKFCPLRFLRRKTICPLTHSSKNSRSYYLLSSTKNVSF